MWETKYKEKANHIIRRGRGGMSNTVHHYNMENGSLLF